MSLADRLFRRSAGPRLELAALQTSLTATAVRLAGQPVDIDLLRARLADGCRTVNLAPLAVDEFDALSQGLDEEAWRRLALAVTLLDLDSVRNTLPALSGSRKLAELVSAAFTELARDIPLLTLELLRQSPLRVEEFARQFIARLGATVQGESPAESKRRLERLDYATILHEAERAKLAADERVERLRKLQDEKEKSRSRRGKW